MKRDPLYTERARQLRAEMGEAERRLWWKLRGRKMADFKFRRQYAIGDYIADFASIRGCLVIEVDGGQHNEDANALKDASRTEYMERCGYRVLRFWNSEVLLETDDVVDAIWNALAERFPSLQNDP